MIKKRVQAFEDQFKSEWETRLIKESETFFSELDQLSSQYFWNIEAQKILSRAKQDWLVEEQMEKETLLRAELSNNPRWLLIFDNVKSDDSKKKTLSLIYEISLENCIIGGGDIMITTRSGIDWEDSQTERCIRMDELTPDESLKLLSIYGIPPEPEEKNAKELAEALMNLPLAIENAARFIKAKGQTYTKYLEGYRRRPKEVARSQKKYYEKY